MKKILVLAVLLFSFSVLRAQQGPQQQPLPSPAARLAQHIADKMADSLGLSPQQRAKVIAVNMELFKQKTDARKKSADRAVVGKELQRIENARDTLYKGLLTEAQYTLYLQKKRNLVRNN